MKKTLFTSFLAIACLSSTVAAADDTITYTTENGYFYWSGEGNNDQEWSNYCDSSLNTSTDTLTFSINSSSVNASKPVGSTDGASLTTATDASNNILSDASLATGTTVNLESIMILGADTGANWTGITLTITGADGSTVATSTSISVIQKHLTYDPWASSEPTQAKYSVAAATFGFEDDIQLIVGDVYTITLSSYVNLKGTILGDDGFSIDGSSINSAAGLTIVTTERIPEPATATLSLLALAGLMLRRRRQA